MPGLAASNFCLRWSKPFVSPVVPPQKLNVSSPFTGPRLAFDPALLNLDEATSSNDTETEQLNQHAIELVLRDRTSIVVAHRLSTVQRADQILVLHHGELRERGTHQQLLARRDLYWRLYKLQYADDSRRDALPEAPLRDSLQYGD